MSKQNSKENKTVVTLLVLVSLESTWQTFFKEQIQRRNPKKKFIKTTRKDLKKSIAFYYLFIHWYRRNLSQEQVRIMSSVQLVSFFGRQLRDWDCIGCWIINPFLSRNSMPTEWVFFWYIGSILQCWNSMVISVKVWNSAKWKLLMIETLSLGNSPQSQLLRSLFSILWVSNTVHNGISLWWLP